MQKTFAALALVASLASSAALAESYTCTGKDDYKKNFSFDFVLNKDNKTVIFYDKDKRFVAAADIKGDQISFEMENIEGGCTFNTSKSTLSCGAMMWSVTDASCKEKRGGGILF